MQIGPYPVTNTLGASAIGADYVAQHPQSGQAVWVQLLVELDPGFRATFERDLQASRIEHPCLWPVIDAGWIGNQPFLVRALREGKPLPTVLGAQGPLAAEHVRALGLEISAALRTLHAHGVVHGTLNSSSVWLDRDGSPFLCDVGLSSFLLLARSHSGETASLAPELSAGSQGPLVDLYGLGGVLYEALTGRAPWGLPPAQRDPRQVRGDLPPDLSAACARALAIQPQERWPSLEAFESALRGQASPAQTQVEAGPGSTRVEPERQAQTQVEEPSRPETLYEEDPPRPRASRRELQASTPRVPPLLVVGGVVLLALLSAGVGGFWMWKKDQARSAAWAALERAREAPSLTDAELELEAAQRFADQDPVLASALAKERDRWALLSTLEEELATSRGDALSSALARAREAGLLRTLAPVRQAAAEAHVAAAGEDLEALQEAVSDAERLLEGLDSAAGLERAQLRVSALELASSLPWDDRPLTPKARSRLEEVLVALACDPDLATWSVYGELQLRQVLEEVRRSARSNAPLELLLRRLTRGAEELAPWPSLAGHLALERLSCHRRRAVFQVVVDEAPRLIDSKDSRVSRRALLLYAISLARLGQEEKSQEAMTRLSQHQGDPHAVAARLWLALGARKRVGGLPDPPAVFDAVLSAAWISWRQGDQTRAASLLERARALGPDQLRLAYVEGHFQRAPGNYKTWSQALNRAEGPWPEFLVITCRAAISVGQLGEAERYLQQLEAASKEDPVVAILRAVFFDASGRGVEARETLQLAVKKFGAAKITALARAHYLNPQLLAGLQASSYMDSYPKPRVPELPAGPVGLALRKLHEGASLEEVSKILAGVRAEGKAESEQLALARAEAFYRRGRYAEVERIATPYLNRTDRVALRMRTFLAMSFAGRLRGIEDAYPLLQAIAEADPKGRDGLYASASLQAIRLQGLTGLKEARLCVEQDPGFLDGHLAVAYSLARNLARQPTAKVALARVRSLCQGYPRMHYLAGLLAQNEGHYEQAIRDFSRALRLTGNAMLTAVERRYVCGLRLKRYDIVREDLLLLLEGEPRNEHYAWTLGLACYQLRRDDEARAAFRKSYSLNDKAALRKLTMQHPEVRTYIEDCVKDLLPAQHPARDRR